MMYIFPRRLLRWLGPLGLLLTTVFLTILLGTHSSLGFPGAESVGVSVSSVAEIQPAQEGARASQPQALLQTGREHYGAGQFSAAIATWLEAETQFTAQHDALHRAITLSNLALAYRQLGQWSAAAETIRKSLALLEQQKTLTPQSLRVYGQVLNTQGGLYLSQGQAQQALDTWEQATDIYTQANYVEGIAKSLMNQSHALRSLGFFRESRNRLSAVAVLLDGQDEASLRLFLTRSLGDNQRLLGDIKASQASLEESLRWAKAWADPRELAATRLSLGNTLKVKAQQQESIARRTGERTNLDEADALYRRALDTYGEIGDNAPLLLQTRAQLNRLEITIHRQDWAVVEALKPALLSQVDSLPMGRASAFAHMRLARLLMDPWAMDAPRGLRNSRQDVYRLLAKARNQALDMQDSMAESYALGYLGHLYEVERRYGDAQRFTEAALVKSRQPSLIYQWEWQLGRIEQELRHDLADVLRHYDVAFENVQTVRNDLLYVEPDVQFDFRDRIEPLYREYIGLLLPKDAAPGQGDSAQLVRAQTVIDDLRVAELESFLACGLIEPNDNVLRTSIQAVANAEKTTAIIYPIIVPDGAHGERLEVLLQLPNQAIKRYPSRSFLGEATHTAGVKDSDIEKKLERFRVFLNRQTFIFPKSGQLLAGEIYDWLIRPAEDQGLLESMDTLVFVLDGAFRKIPMAALYDQQMDQFLIEKYAIAVTFGDLEIPADAPAKTFNVLAAGLSSPSVLSPDPNPTASRGTRVTSELAFVPLPFVEKEIESIVTIVEDADHLLNRKFTKKSFQTKMRSSDYSVVHLATHGVFGFTRDETFLLVAASEEESTPPVDGSLGESIEVGKIDLNEFDSLLKTRNQTPLELLVLSACETATGDSRELLGIAGLAVQSGARSTLATLWRINDLSTSLLMADFYGQMVDQGFSKAKALQKAQIQLLKQRPHPFQWAPYLLVGDWR